MSKRARDEADAVLLKRKKKRTDSSQAATSWLNASVELEEGEDADLSALVRAQAAKFLSQLKTNKKQLDSFLSEKRLADGVDDDPSLVDDGDDGADGATKTKKKKVKKSLEELREESRKNRERQEQRREQEDKEAAKQAAREERAKQDAKKQRAKGKLFGVNDDIWDD